MDARARARYRREAAMAKEQGFRNVSIRPADLLSLLVAYEPPPPASVAEKTVVDLRRQLRDSESRVRELSRRINQARAEGRHEGVLSQAREVDRLRMEVARVNGR